MTDSWIRADWPLSGLVSAGTTTRLGGLSSHPWDSLNLGLHVGDDSNQVVRNRQLISKTLKLPSEPVWLNQTHGTAVCDVSPAIDSSYDAAWTDDAERVLVVLTADCLPVVIGSEDGRELGVAHAGWRGLANGVLTALLQRFTREPGELQAWLGPAIGPHAFEVGDEVRDYFIHQWSAQDHDAISAAFIPGDSGKWFADLYALARITLKRHGLDQIYGGQWCTLSDQERFFSYRRDGVNSGRMATFAWRSKR